MREEFQIARFCQSVWKREGRHRDRAGWTEHDPEPAAGCMTAQLTVLVMMKEAAASAKSLL